MPTVTHVKGWRIVATVCGHRIDGLTCPCPFCNSQLMLLAGTDGTGQFLCADCGRHGWWELAEDGAYLTEM